MNIIKQEIAALRTRLDELEAKTAGMNTVAIPASSIELTTGERYAGLMLNEFGAPSHHLILMAEQKESINWADAIEWSASIGGVLPSRAEQALLYANLKDQFESSYYWSSERHSDARYAWSQDFSYGYQYGSNVFINLRARAVRRSVI